MEIEEGHLALASDIFPHIDQPNICGQLKPRFEGTTDEYLQLHPSFTTQLKNWVKVCPRCLKSNGVTLSHCNQCYENLENIKQSTTNNVFTAFIYGIEKGPFPFTISIRYEDQDFLVFDDLLQISPCHVNIIPTSVFCPDWTYLLSSPQQGFILFEKLLEIGWNVILTQFLSNPEWKRKVLKNSEDIPNEKFKDYLLVGCNFPPSQNQLHLQMALPPYVPYFWAYLKDNPPRKRFCPYDYIHKILSLPPEPILFKPGEDDINIIFQYYKNTKDIDYDLYFDEYCHQQEMMQNRFDNWAVEDFNGVIIKDKVFKWGDEKERRRNNIIELENMDKRMVIRKDTEVTQNYGRPYKDGKPVTKYYSFPKNELLETFGKKISSRV